MRMNGSNELVHPQSFATNPVNPRGPVWGLRCTLNNTSYDPFGSRTTNKTTRPFPLDSIGETHLVESSI